MKIYHFDTLLTEGRFKDDHKTVQEAFDEDHGIIFNLIKKYKYNFDDEVLAAANITKTIRDHQFVNVVIDRRPPKNDNKKYKKEKKSLDEILDEICEEHVKFNDDYQANIPSDEYDNVEMPIEPEV